MDKLRDRSWDHSPAHILRSVPRWPVIAAIASLTLAPVALRNLRLPYWYDEAFTIRAGDLPWRSLVRVLRADGGNMFGHTIALKLVRSLTHDRTALRLLTLVAAAAAVVLVYRLVRRAASERAAAIAAVMLATNVVFVHYATELRSYGFLPLSLVLVAGSLAKLVEEPRRVDWLRLGLLAGVASNLHHTATFGVAALLGAALTTSAGRSRWRRFVLAIGVWIACSVTAWWMAVSDQADQVSWIPPLSRSRLLAILRDISGTSLETSFAVWGLALVGVVAIRTTRSATGARPIEATLLAGWLLGMPLLMAVASTQQSLMVPRYFIGVVPALAATAAVGLDWGLRRSAAHDGLAVALIVGVAIAALPLRPGERDEPWDVVLQRLAARVEPSDGIAFSPREMRLPFDLNGADHPRDFARVTRAKVVGSTVPWGRFDHRIEFTPLDDSLAAHVDQVWLVRQDWAPDDEQTRTDVLRRYRVAESVQVGKLTVELFVRR